MAANPKLMEGVFVEETTPYSYSVDLPLFEEPAEFNHEEARDKAFWTSSIISPDFKSIEQNYDSVFNEFKTYGFSNLYDNAVNDWRHKQEPLNRELIAEKLEDPTITYSIKQDLIRGYQQDLYTSTDLKDAFQEKTLEEREINSNTTFNDIQQEKFESRQRELTDARMDKEFGKMLDQFFKNYSTHSENLTENLPWQVELSGGIGSVPTEQELSEATIKYKQTARAINELGETINAGLDWFKGPYSQEDIEALEATLDYDNPPEKYAGLPPQGIRHSMLMDAMEEAGMVADSAIAAEILAVPQMAWEMVRFIGSSAGWLSDGLIQKFIINNPDYTWNEAFTAISEGLHLTNEELMQSLENGEEYKVFLATYRNIAEGLGIEDQFDNALATHALHTVSGAFNVLTSIISDISGFPKANIDGMLGLYFGARAIPHYKKLKAQRKFEENFKRAEVSYRDREVTFTTKDGTTRTVHYPINKVIYQADTNVLGNSVIKFNKDGSPVKEILFETPLDVNSKIIPEGIKPEYITKKELKRRLENYDSKVPYEPYLPDNFNTLNKQQQEAATREAMRRAAANHQATRAKELENVANEEAIVPEIKPEVNNLGFRDTAIEAANELKQDKYIASDARSELLSKDGFVNDQYSVMIDKDGKTFDEFLPDRTTNSEDAKRKVTKKEIVEWIKNSTPKITIHEANTGSGLHAIDLIGIDELVWQTDPKALGIPTSIGDLDLPHIYNLIDFQTPRFAIEHLDDLNPRVDIDQEFLADVSLETRGRLFIPEQYFENMYSEWVDPVVLGNLFSRKEQTVLWDQKADLYLAYAKPNLEIRTTEMVDDVDNIGAFVETITPSHPKYHKIIQNYLKVAAHDKLDPGSSLESLGYNNVEYALFIANRGWRVYQGKDNLKKDIPMELMDFERLDWTEEEALSHVQDEIELPNISETEGYLENKNWQESLVFFNSARRKILRDTVTAEELAKITDLMPGRVPTDIGWGRDQYNKGHYPNSNTSQQSEFLDINESYIQLPAASFSNRAMEQHANKKGILSFHRSSGRYLEDSIYEESGLLTDTPLILDYAGLEVWHFVLPGTSFLDGYKAFYNEYKLIQDMGPGGEGGGFQWLERDRDLMQKMANDVYIPRARFLEESQNDMAQELVKAYHDKLEAYKVNKFEENPNIYSIHDMTEGKEFALSPTEISTIKEEFIRERYGEYAYSSKVDPFDAPFLNKFLDTKKWTYFNLKDFIYTTVKNNKNNYTDLIIPTGLEKALEWKGMLPDWGGKSIRIEELQGNRIESYDDRKTFNGMDHYYSNIVASQFKQLAKEGGSSIQSIFVPEFYHSDKVTLANAFAQHKTYHLKNGEGYKNLETLMESILAENNKFKLEHLQTNTKEIDKELFIVQDVSQDVAFRGDNFDKARIEFDKEFILDDLYKSKIMPDTRENLFKARRQEMIDEGRTAESLDRDFEKRKETVLRASVHNKSIWSHISNLYDAFKGQNLNISMLDAAIKSIESRGNKLLVEKYPEQAAYIMSLLTKNQLSLPPHDRAPGESIMFPEADPTNRQNIIDYNKQKFPRVTEDYLMENRLLNRFGFLKDPNTGMLEIPMMDGTIEKISILEAKLINMQSAFFRNGIDIENHSSTWGALETLHKFNSPRVYRDALFGMDNSIKTLNEIGFEHPDEFVGETTSWGFRLDSYDQLPESKVVTGENIKSIFNEFANIWRTLEKVYPYGYRKSMHITDTLKKHDFSYFGASKKRPSPKKNRTKVETNTSPGSGLEPRSRFMELHLKNPKAAIELVATLGKENPQKFEEAFGVHPLDVLLESEWPRESNHILDSKDLKLNEALNEAHPIMNNPYDAESPVSTQEVAKQIGALHDEHLIRNGLNAFSTQNSNINVATELVIREQIAGHKHIDRRTSYSQIRWNEKGEQVFFMDQFYQKDREHFFENKVEAFKKALEIKQAEKDYELIDSEIYLIDTETWKRTPLNEVNIDLIDQVENIPHLIEVFSEVPIFNKKGNELINSFVPKDFKWLGLFDYWKTSIYPSAIVPWVHTQGLFNEHIDRIMGNLEIDKSLWPEQVIRPLIAKMSNILQWDEKGLSIQLRHEKVNQAFNSLIQISHEYGMDIIPEEMLTAWYPDLGPAKRKDLMTLYNAWREIDAQLHRLNNDAQRRALAKDGYTKVLNINGFDFWFKNQLVAVKTDITAVPKLQYYYNANDGTIMYLSSENQNFFRKEGEGKTAKVLDNDGNQLVRANHSLVFDINEKVDIINVETGEVITDTVHEPISIDHVSLSHNQVHLYELPSKVSPKRQGHMAMIPVNNTYRIYRVPYEFNLNGFRNELVLDKNNKLDSNANTAVLASSLTEVAGVYPDKAVALKALEEFKKNDMRGIYHYEVEKAKETRETTNDAMTITNQVYATNQRVPTDLSKSEFMSPIAALLLQEKQVVGNFLEDRHGDYVRNLWMDLYGRFLKTEGELLETREGPVENFPVSVEQMVDKQSILEIDHLEYDVARGFLKKYLAAYDTSKGTAHNVLDTSWRMMADFADMFVIDQTKNVPFLGRAGKALNDVADTSDKQANLLRTGASTFFITLNWPYKHWILQGLPFWEMMLVPGKSTAAIKAAGRFMPTYLTWIMAKGKYDKDLQAQYRFMEELVLDKDFKHRWTSKEELAYAHRAFDFFHQSIAKTPELANIHSYARELERFENELSTNYLSPIEFGKKFADISKRIGFMSGELVNKFGHWSLIKEEWQKQHPGLDITRATVERTDENGISYMENAIMREARILDEAQKMTHQMTQWGTPLWMNPKVPGVATLGQFMVIMQKLGVEPWQTNFNNVRGLQKFSRMALVRPIIFGVKAAGSPYGVGALVGAIFTQILAQYPEDEEQLTEQQRIEIGQIKQIQKLAQEYPPLLDVFGTWMIRQYYAMSPLGDKSILNEDISYYDKDNSDLISLSPYYSPFSMQWDQVWIWPLIQGVISAEISPDLWSHASANVYTRIERLLKDTHNLIVHRDYAQFTNKDWSNFFAGLASLTSAGRNYLGKELCISIFNSDKKGDFETNSGERIGLELNKTQCYGKLLGGTSEAEQAFHEAVSESIDQKQLIKNISKDLSFFFDRYLADNQDKKIQEPYELRILMPNIITALNNSPRLDKDDVQEIVNRVLFNQENVWDSKTNSKETAFMKIIRLQYLDQFTQDMSESEKLYNELIDKLPNHEGIRKIINSSQVDVMRGIQKMVEIYERNEKERKEENK